MKKCKFNHTENETCEECAKRVEELMKTVSVIKSGYAGVLPNGNIVDRREFPKATPIQENKMFRTPKPIKL